MIKAKLLLAVAALSLSSTTMAGEITGNGKWTPPHFHSASSICSFSGLNDTPWDIFGFVQTYAVVKKLFGIQPGDADHPGQACRGN